MPAVSKKQQRFFGIVRAAQKGTLPTGKTTPEVQRAASSMKKKDVKKMASTKHKGLPEKKKKVDEDVDFTYPNVRHNRRFSTGMKLSMNPTTGMGAKKSTKNNPDGDDIRNSTYNSIKRKERKKDAMARKVASKIMSIKKESFNEDAKMAKQSDEKLQAAHKKFSGMEKSPANTFMLKRIQREMNKRKKNVKYSMKEDYVKELEDGLVKMDYPSYDEVDKLMCKIAKENDIDTTTLHMAFKTKHLMVPDDWAKKKMMEPVMIPKTPEMKEELDKNDKPFVKKLVGKLRKGSNTHAKQADDLEKAMNEGVNINEDDGNYFMNKIAKEKGLDLTDPRQRRRANSLARHNAAKGNVNNPAGFSKRKKRKKMNEAASPAQQAAIAIDMKKKGKKPKSMIEGNLHQWFKGSKSKDGKGGWVNVVTGGTCASDEPGEGTPKCVSSSKRASMTKAERLSAARRKKKADPNQQSKTGAAKPTYVSTDKPKKKVNEDVEGRKTALTEPKTKTERLARKKDSEIRREAERAMYDTSAGESEIVKRQRIAKKLRSSSIPKNQEKGGQMEIDTTKKLVGEEFGKMTKEQEDIYVGNKAGRIKFDRITDYKKRQELKKNLKKYPGDEDHTTTTAEAYSSKPSNLKKKAKLTAMLNRLQDLKVKKKLNEMGNYPMGKGPNYRETQNLPKKEVKKPEKPVVNLDAKGRQRYNPDNFQRQSRVTTKYDQQQYEPEMDMVEAKSPAWQRKAGKSESGGLNAKGVASYRAANPGSKLKTAVTTKPSKLKKGSKSAKRRTSFCKRMKGMKSKLTSAKTARDPDSRINKALRKWNCSFEPEHGEMISEGKVSGMIKSLRRKTKVLEKGQKKNRDAGAIAAKIMKQKEHNKYVNFLPVDDK